MKSRAAIFTVLAVQALCLSVCPHEALAQEASTSAGEIDRQIDEQVLALLEIDPETLSGLGIISPETHDEPFRTLTDQGSEQLAADRNMRGSFLKTMSAIDESKLSADQRLSLRIWTIALSNDLQVLEAGSASLDRPYVVDQFWLQGFSQLFLRTHQLSSPFMAEAFVERLEQVAEVVGQRRTLFEKEVMRGVLPPQAVLDRAIADIDTLLVPEPSDHPFIRRLLNEMPQELTEADVSRLVERATNALRDDFYPAFRELQSALIARRQEARTEKVGLVGLENGDALYKAFAQRWTTTEIDPDEVHEIGLAEVARIQAEMSRRMDALGIKDGSFLERMAQVEAAGLYGFPSDTVGEQALIEHANHLIAEAQQKTAPYFNRFPRTELLVVPVPESARASASASYSPPASDGSRPGVFNLNPRDPASYGDFGFPSLVYHEAIPGHHYQIALQMEMDLPLARQILPFSAYVEGWALYVEGRAEEMGLYEGNEIGALGAYLYELYRAARLVVDTGLHQKGWSREQALQFMNNTMGETSEREIDRYIAMPGQALSYKIGHLKIEELRHRAEGRLGARFDVAAFHDMILSEGAMPLNLLDERLEAWIESESRASLTVN